MNTIVDLAATDWEKGVDEARAEMQDTGPEAAMLEFAAKVANPRAQLDELSSQFSALLGEVESINADLKRYDGNSSRLPSRPRAVAVFAATLVAFASGVMLPLVDTEAPALIYVGLPCAIYACGFAIAGTYLWRASSLSGA